MARLFTIFGDGHVRDGIDVNKMSGAATINIGNCTTPVLVTESLLDQCKTPADQYPLSINEAVVKLSAEKVELHPESKETAQTEPANKQALVLLDPRCWWHSQNKVNSGITEVYYHINPKNIILSGQRHFGAEGLTHCQTLLVRFNIGDEVLIGFKRTVGEGGTLNITKETLSLIYTGETFAHVPKLVLHWRREVA
jgi:hypothetical protein